MQRLTHKRNKIAVNSNGYLITHTRTNKYYTLQITAQTSRKEQITIKIK